MERPVTILSAEEIRVLGVLMEKSKTTPDYYPMTVNAITAACNQKTSRRPVVEYDEETVSRALSSLKGQSLVATAVGGGSRVVKYKHNFGTIYPDVSDAGMAIICMLFLRGPQTPGELNTNSGRLYEFSSLESVHEALNALRQEPNPMVKELPRRAGQKETRFIHLFAEFNEAMEEESAAEAPVHSGHALEARLSQVEKELAEVKEQVARLLKELNG